MNLVGKIFIVLIFVMSLVFMSFAVAVYATHQNWRLVVERKPEDERLPDAPKGLKYKLQDARKDNQDLKDEHERLRGEIAAELKDKKTKLATLENELVKLTAQHVEMKKQRDELENTNKMQVATLTTEGENLKALTAEVEGLRNEIRVAQADRDKSFKTVVSLTEDIVQAQGQLSILKERSVQLSAEIAKQKKVLESVGLTIDTPPGDKPPRMQGKVLAVNRDKMIEISLGSDDGLRVGHTLEVFRGSKYLGRVEVMSITFNRAVAKIVPGYQQGVIQKGDDVATRLKVS